MTRFSGFVGYDREDLVAGRLRSRDLTLPEWRDRTARALAEREKTGTIEPYETEYFRRDGSRVPVLIGGAALDEPGDQGVAFVLDLTERKQAEAALRASEERWRAMFETAPVGVTMRAFEHRRYVTANESFQRMIGIPRASCGILRRWISPTRTIGQQRDGQSADFGGQSPTPTRVCVGSTRDNPL
jgi:PAS domain S-box-containing protein